MLILYIFPRRRLTRNVVISVSIRVFSIYLNTSLPLGVSFSILFVFPFIFSLFFSFSVLSFLFFVFLFLPGVGRHPDLHASVHVRREGQHRGSVGRPPNGRVKPGQGQGIDEQSE